MGNSIRNDNDLSLNRYFQKESKANGWASILDSLRRQNPLVHHITNYVTVNDCANAVLAIGAAPVMADELAEVCDIVHIASALVINIGTLNQRTIASMLAAGKEANAVGIPVILDTVGAGASALRTRTAEQLIKEIRFAVIRGNISEIKVLSGKETQTKGVDAAASDMADHIEGSRTLARQLANETDSVIAITGETDVISNGKTTYLLKNGHEMMSKITGTGCMCTSLIGACCGVTKDYLGAATAAVTVMGVAGEDGYRRMNGENIGNLTYRTQIVDAIYRMSGERMDRGGRLFV